MKIIHKTTTDERPVLGSLINIISGGHGALGVSGIAIVCYSPCSAIVKNGSTASDFYVMTEQGELWALGPDAELEVMS